MGSITLLLQPNVSLDIQSGTITTIVGSNGAGKSTLLKALYGLNKQFSGAILLDGNENPYGPSPSARQAIVASAGDAARYADKPRTALMAQLAAHEGVTVSQIVLGTGSGELLKMAGLLAMTGSARRGVIAS